MFIDVDAKGALQMLADQYDKLTDTEPLMEDIADIMLDAVEQNFADEGRPQWAELQESTLKHRRKINKESSPILQVHAAGLASSISDHTSKDEAIVGTNKVYAPTHQFGAKKGEYGTTKYGVPIPWGDIPARPFLTLADSDIDEIRDIVLDYLDV